MEKYSGAGTVYVEVMCKPCQFEETDYYRRQGDSGFDYRCAHPLLTSPRDKGDSRCPHWCPESEKTIDKIKSRIQIIINGYT